MRITVKVFASYRELLGEDEIDLEMDDGATVGEAIELVRRHYRALADQGYAPLTACNLKHVGKRHALRDGDELAIFPPVSGG